MKNTNLRVHQKIIVRLPNRDKFCFEIGGFDGKEFDLSDLIERAENGETIHYFFKDIEISTEKLPHIYQDGLPINPIMSKSNLLNPPAQESFTSKIKRFFR